MARLIRLVGFLLSISAAAYGVIPPFGGSDDTVTVMFYNVENLFDLKDDGGEYEQFQADNVTWDTHAYERKRFNIASVIAAHRPDIIGLCEIETEQALKDLQRACRRRGRTFHYRAIGDSPHPSNTCCALLSRFPLVKVQTYGVGKTGQYYTRNILEAHVAVGNDTLVVFVNHWPSKRWPESARIRAAGVLVRALETLPAGADYLILGDLNANYDEAESGLTYGLDDSQGFTSINHHLRTVRSQPHQPADYIREPDMRSGGRGHYDLWLELPAWQRFSAMYRGHRQTPDHILVGPALYDNTGFSYVDNSFFASTWHGRLLWYGKPYRWKIAYTREGMEHVGAGYSDHLPVIAQFRRGPFTPAESDNVTSCDKRSSSGGLSGFERGAQGWVGWSPGVWVRRDTAEAARGCWALRIEGKTRRNATVARTVLIPGRCNIAQGRTFSIDMKGAGALAFRIRKRPRAWQYYAWQEYLFKPVSNASYKKVSLPEWHTVHLPLAEYTAAGDTLEVELRAKKNVSTLLWIDNAGIVERHATPAPSRVRH